MFIDTNTDINNTKEDLGFPKYLDLGTISDDFTLVKNKVVTGDITGGYSLSLPDLTDSNKSVECIFDFTTNNSAYPQITNENIKKKNNTELVYSTTAGDRNRLIFTSFNGSGCWLVELEVYGEL